MWRVVGWCVLGLGGLLAGYSVVAGMLADNWADTLVWLAPEVGGCLLVVLGLHMVIDP